MAIDISNFAKVADATTVRRLVDRAYGSLVSQAITVRVALRES